MPPRMPPRPGGPRLNIEALIAHHERPVSAAGGDRPQTAEHDASGLVDLPRRRGRESFRVSSGGQTLSMLSHSQEWAINPQGVQRGLTTGLVQMDECSAADMMEFNVIGHGASSVVRKAIHVPSHRFVALKCISVLEKDKRAQLVNELRLLCDGSTQSIRGVIRYIGTYYAPDSNTINVALEYMDAGSLETLVRRAGPLPEGIVARIAADVLDGLSWLHRDRRLVHRDIKPGNILLNSAGEPKITDFGISTGLDIGRSTIGLHAGGAGKGTMCYMSPERLSNASYSFSADVWSLGVTLLECFTGAYPFPTHEGPVGTMLEIMEGDVPLPPPETCSPGFRDFLATLLRPDPRSRPAAHEARRHGWLASATVSNQMVAAFLGAVIDPAESQLSLAQMFAAHYYALMDRQSGDRSALEGLYREDASYTFAGGTRARGPTAICAALSELGDTSHSPAFLDCQPFAGGGVLAVVSGTVIAAFESTRFTEAFALLPGSGPGEDGRWWLTSHFRANHGPAGVR